MTLPNGCICDPPGLTVALNWERTDELGLLDYRLALDWVLLYMQVSPTGYTVQTHWIYRSPAQGPNRACPIGAGSLWTTLGQKQAPCPRPWVSGLERCSVLRALDGQHQDTTPRAEGGSFQFFVMFSLNVEYKKKLRCDFVDFALVNYLSVHAHHCFYM